MTVYYSTAGAKLIAQSHSTVFYEKGKFLILPPIGQWDNNCPFR